MEDTQLPRVETWFADHGFSLQIHQDKDESYWVDLVSLETGDVVAPRYGRGVDAVAAATRAKSRYQEEQ
jgi:hypothetical protein